MLLCLLLVCGGASCVKREPLVEFNPPVVFEAPPTLEEVIAKVNRSLSIQRFESNTVSISSPEIITRLTGNLKWERPYSFKLEAYPGTRLMGLALAAGSNADMFWLQTRVPPPPTLYYARYDEFERQSGPRRILPVSPLWIREALGVVEMDPAGRHEGPTMRSDGKMEVVSYIPSPRGDYRRVLVMDPKTATIEQTLLYNHESKLVAYAQQSRHEYYSGIDWSLPRKVDIQLRPDEGPAIAFTIEIGFYMLNDASASDRTAFVPPDPTGISTVDLVRANASMQGAPMAPPAYRPNQAPPPRNAMINYRTVR